MIDRTPDSDDIERAVYDGMQDLRVPKPAPKRRLKRPAKPKKAKKRR